MNESIAKLEAVRRRMRFLLAGDGIARLIAASVACFALLALLDWWVHFPALVRWSFLVAGLCWIAAWSYKRIWRPLAAPVALDQLALSLRMLSPELRDRLASLVSFERRGSGDGSAALWTGIGESATDALSDVDWGAGLNARRPRRSIIAAGLVLASLAFGLSSAPRMVQIGWHRIIRPSTSVEWPRGTQIEPLTLQAVVVHGEAFTAEMRLARGDSERVRGFMSWSGGDRPTERGMMRRDPDGVYRRVVENVTTPMRIVYSAGDDDTRERPCMLRVVRRPIVEIAKLVLIPPEYAKHIAPHEQTLTEGRASAVRGSRVRIEVTADRVVTGDGSDIGRKPSRVAFEGGQELNLTTNPSDPRRLFCEFTAESSRSFDIVLVDAEGFESRGGPRYQLDVTADRPPSVAVKEPTGTLEVLPEAIVTLKILAEDDIGVESVTVIGGARGTEPGTVADISISASDAKSSGGRGAEGSRGNHGRDARATRTRVVADIPWSLGPLKLSAGDVVEYFAEARDGYKLGGDVHKPSRSGVMRLNVVSPAQFAQRLRQDLMGMRGQLRKLLDGLEALHGGTQAIAGRAARAMSEQDRAMVERLTAEARRLTGLGQETTRQLEQMARRADWNKAADCEPAKQVQRLSRGFERSVAGELARAASSLGRAAEVRRGEESHEALKESTAFQESAIKSLQAMTDEIDRWDNFDEIVRKLHELIDRQESVTRDTARHVPGVLADGRESTSSLETARAATGQSSLQAETAKVLSAMELLARQVAENDPPASESLARARNAGLQHGVVESMSEAAEAIRSGRFDDGAKGQERSAAGLRAMWAALNEKPQRELEQLSRKTQDARQRLLKIIAAQEDLVRRNKLTQGTEDAVVRLGSLADRQASLETTTRALSEKPGVTGSEADEAAEELLAGAEQMSTAAAYLRDANGSEAEEAQHGALSNLAAALAVLDRLDRRTQEELAEKSMAAIVDALREIRKTQTAIRDESAAVAARLRGRSTVPRSDGLAMNRLGKEEDALAAPLAAVREKISQSAVYDFVTGQAAEAISGASKSLAEHRIDDSVALEEAVIRHLTRLIDAVEEPRNKDDSQFAGEQGGGGGANHPTASNPVPTLAELKVLRHMQVEVNDQTAALNGKLPDALARSEAQLKQIDALGTSQRQIRELAVKMIDKAGKQGER